MDKFKKIDKEFLLSDSSVNVYGFRLLTSGYMIDEYKKNPIGYFMHLRDAGVLVRWEDLRIENDAVYGKPVINMSNPRAQQTVDEIENGFLNAASFGHFVVLEYSDDPAMKLPGQSGPTVTKWFNRESSLVDIPGNMNALALFDKDDNPINLADFTSQTKILLMKQITLTAANLAAMNLAADADDATIATAFSNLVAKAKQADDLQTQLANLKSEQNKQLVKDMLSTALNVDKKITKELSDKLASDYADKPELLKDLLAALPKFSPINKDLTDDDPVKADKIAELAKLSGIELYRKGKLEELKALSLEHFKPKYKEAFGVDYKE